MRNLLSTGVRLYLGRMIETLPMPTRFRLAELLEEREMSQNELARRSGISQVTVNAIANNRTTRVDLSTLDALARVLKCEPGDLLERTRR